MTQPDRSDADYAARLGDVLRSRDPEALREFLTDNARRFGDAAQVVAITTQTADEIEALMHRMIVARPDLLPIHEESQSWLASHGLARTRQQSARAPGSRGTGKGPGRRPGGRP